MSTRFTYFNFSLFSGFFLLVACASEPKASSSAKVCDSLSPGQACSIQSKGGDLLIKLSKFSPQEEYLIFVQSFAEVDPTKELRLRFRMSSNIASASPPASEIELKKKLDRNWSRMWHQRDLNESIPLPHNSYSVSRSLDWPSDFYIPSLDDYKSVFNGDKLPFYVRTDDNPLLKGNRREFSLIERLPNLADILLDEGYASHQNFVEKFEAEIPCLEEVLSDFYEVLGRPIDLKPTKSEIEILISHLESSAGKTIGLFNKLDRFQTFRGKSIPDSNFGEIIYLSPQISQAKVCATVAHELQHLINFDAKVISRIPEDRRKALEAIEEFSLRSEHDGLNEAYSYLIEMLTGKYQNVFELAIQPAMRSPDGLTYALELSSATAESNLKSRGLNTLFLLHAFHRAGGTWNWKDPQTQNFLKSIILSPHIGFENIAYFFQETKMMLFENFYRSWALSLYDSRSAREFLPPEAWSSSEVPLGIRILDRDAPVDELELFPNSHHPLQTDLKLLSRSHSWVLQAEGVSIFRLIVPETLNSHQKENLRLHIQGSQTPFGIFVVRVR